MPAVEEGKMIETAHDAQAFVERLTYRPGWRLRAGAAFQDRPSKFDDGFVRLELRAWVHDSFFEGEHRFEVGPGYAPEPLQFNTSLTPTSFITATPQRRIECDTPAVEIQAQKTFHIGRMTELDFLHLIRHWLGEVEMHERDEWLRVDGDMPFNPHAAEAT